MIFLKITLIAISFVAITLNHHCLAPSMEQECQLTLSLHYNYYAKQGLYNVDKSFYEKTEKKIKDSFPFVPNADAAAETKRKNDLGFVLGYFQALLDSLYDIIDLSELWLEEDFCTKEAAIEKYENNTLILSDIKTICHRHVAILLKNRNQYPVNRFKEESLNLRWSTLRVIYTEWAYSDITITNVTVNYGSWTTMNISEKRWYLTIFGGNFYNSYRYFISKSVFNHQKIPDVKTYCKRYAPKKEATMSSLE